MIAYQITNKHGYDAGTDDGRMTVFESEQAASDWLHDNSDFIPEELTVKKITLESDEPQWNIGVEVREIARLALQDADFFDRVAEDMDLSDEQMLIIRDNLQKDMED